MVEPNEKIKELKERNERLVKVIDEKNYKIIKGYVSMAIALSIVISLIAGITAMYQTQYFWGKESNDNINTMNNSMNTLTDSVGTSTSLGAILVVVAVLIVAVLMCSCRGF